MIKIADQAGQPGWSDHDNDMHIFSGAARSRIINVCTGKEIQANYTLENEPI